MGATCNLPAPLLNRTVANHFMNTKLAFHRQPLLLVALLLNLPPVQAATFQGLGDLPGSNFASYAMAVSADGRVVTGYSTSSNGTEAFIWTATNGLEALGDLPGRTFASYAQGISSNGTVVVGYSVSSNGTEAFRWTRSTGMQPLGDLPGGSFVSRAFGVSADGQTVVGFASSTLSTPDEAFRWTANSGMVSLGDLPGGKYYSRAWAISADGSVIVGESEGPNGNEAFRWTAATGMVGLGDFPGGWTNSIAYALSPDGSVAVGRGYSGAYDSWTHEAFSWTAASGLVRLGFIPCNDWSIAHAVSLYGTVIVGDPETGRGDCAFIWDSQHGMRNLHQVLTDEHGLNLTGWQLSGARGISYDGTTIVGYGINPAGQSEAWIATGLKPALELCIITNTCHLSWPISFSNFLLQSSDNLLTGWSNCPASWITNGDSIQGTQPVSGNRRFYRLKR